MSKTVQLSQSASEQVSAYATQLGMDANELAEEILMAGLSTLRRLRYYESQPGTVDVSDALEILNRAGAEPPMPGDEIPEGYRRRA